MGSRSAWRLDRRDYGSEYGASSALRALLDSCSVINVVHAGAFELICSLDGIEWWVPPVVVDESGPTCAAVTLDLQQRGLIHFFDDHSVNAERFLRLIEEHRLGAGETECMAIAAESDYHICCDDRRARQVASDLIGADRVFGTIRVLRWCVEQRQIECAEAKRLLRIMREQGGFLPDTPQSFFCRGD
jgi:predicted nucleic acid-binding protein